MDREIAAKHKAAHDWFDYQADNLQRAGVKIRLFHAMKERSADLAAAKDDDAEADIVYAEWIKAVNAEIKGDKLP